MQNFPADTLTRLNDRAYHAHVQSIEDDIAVILSGKSAAEQLTLLIRALMRRGILDMVAVDGDSIRAVNDDLAAIRRALELAHERAKDSRRPTEQLG